MYVYIPVPDTGVVISVFILYIKKQKIFLLLYFFKLLLLLLVFFSIGAVALHAHLPYRWWSCTYGSSHHCHHCKIHVRWPKAACSMIMSNKNQQERKKQTPKSHLMSIDSFSLALFFFNSLLFCYLLFIICYLLFFLFPF